MKKALTLMVAALLCCSVAIAKDLKVLVVKTTPELNSHDVEKKIKGNICFTPGVKRIVTNLDTKLVTVTYDAEKTDSKTLLAAFKKIGFETTVVSDKGAEKKTSGKVPVDATTGATQQKK